MHGMGKDVACPTRHDRGGGVGPRQSRRRLADGAVATSDDDKGATRRVSQRRSRFPMCALDDIRQAIRPFADGADGGVADPPACRWVHQPGRVRVQDKKRDAVRSDRTLGAWLDGIGHAAAQYCYVGGPVVALAGIGGSDHRHTAGR
jgi:hypothetical protein